MVHIVDRLLVMPINASMTGQIMNITSLATITDPKTIPQIDVQTAMDVTIFAPSNAALEKYKMDHDGAEPMQSVYQGLVTQGPSVHYSNTFNKYNQLVTVGNKSVTVTTDFDGGINVNYARIIQPDILTSNGVIHIIDQYVSSLLHPSELRNLVTNRGAPLGFWSDRSSARSLPIPCLSHVLLISALHVRRIFKPFYTTPSRAPEFFKEASACPSLILRHNKARAAADAGRHTACVSSSPSCHLTHPPSLRLICLLACLCSRGSFTKRRIMRSRRGGDGAPASILGVRRGKGPFTH
jgi:hypothetical protein